MPPDLKRAQFGNTGLEISRVGFGAWAIGGGGYDWGWGSQEDDDSIAAIHHALELGVDWIDTAAQYGFGHSEQVVGRALVGLDRRPFVFTKGGQPEGPGRTTIQSLRRDSLLREVHGSLERLGIDSIDLYQVHWPNPVVPIATTMEGMRRVQQSGLVRHVGVSNFSLPQWQAAEEALGGPVLANQVEYNLVARRPERHLLPHAARAGRLIIAYSPLAQGFLSARYDASHPPPGLVRRWNALFLPDNLAAGAELLGALRDIAATHRATAAQVALAWVIRRPNVVAIPGASSVAQLEANAAAADLELSDAEDRQLSAASAAFQPRRGLAAVPGLVTSAWTR